MKNNLKANVYRCKNKDEQSKEGMTNFVLLKDGKK